MVVIEEKDLEALVQRAVSPVIESAFKRLTEKEYLTTGEVAQMLSVSKRTIVGWRSRRLIPFVKLQGKVLYKRTELATFMEHRTIRAKEANADDSRY